LVKYDAALASRTLDGAPESGAPSPETAAGYRLLLKTLAKEKDSLVGSLVTRERDDSNSATQMHFLAGVLAPLFAEISKAERAQKPTLIGSIFARFNREETPEHLKDLGLLETIRPAHTAVIDELGAIRRGAEYSEKAEAASQRERDAEQVKQEADQKRKAEEQAELAKTREERHKKLLKSLTRTLRAAKTSTRRGDDQSEPILDEKTVVCTIYEAIKAAQDVNDRILYAILSECPKGSKAWLAKAGLPLNEAINNHNRTRGGTVWDDKNIGNVALALLWETLSKLSVIHETSRFEETQTQLALYIDGNSYGEVTDYRAEYMNEVRQAFIRLHEKKCQELLP
jgi:Skp family chaperone for outer membrane proteins